MARRLSLSVAKFQDRLGLDSSPFLGGSFKYQAIKLNLSDHLIAVSEPVLGVFLTAADLLDDSSASGNEVERFVLHAGKEFGVLSTLIILIVCPPGRKRAASELLSRKLCLVGQPIIELERALEVQSIGEFARLVAKRAAPEYVSPYQVQYPVGERMLFGRDALVAKLRVAKRHQILVGARRIGKTSVVKAVQRAGLPNGGKVVYVDMADVGHDGWRSLWHELLIQLGFGVKDYEVFARQGKIGQKASRSEFSVSESAALRKVLGNESHRPLLILDEVESWLREDAKVGWTQLEQLRAIADRGRAKLLLVGYEALALAFTNVQFPLYGRARRTVLSTIDRTSMVELVIKPLAQLGITLDPQEQLLASLWQDSSGFPHIIQDVCGELVALTRGANDTKDVVKFHDYQSALARSSAFESFDTGLRNLDFPLAEAIAGVIAYAKGRGVQEVPLEHGDRPTASHRVKEIIGLLKERDPRLTSPLDELELALEYLRIRQIIQPADREATRWRWVNQRVMKNMAKWISGVGLDNWASGLGQKHQAGTWRSKYLGIVKGLS